MFELTEALRHAWPLFREAARCRRTVTYTELAACIGWPATRRNVHRLLLAPLSDRCRRAGLPDLSALVVRRDTGVPGGGWFDPLAIGNPLGAWAEALTACFNHTWSPLPDRRLLEPRGAPDPDLSSSEKRSPSHQSMIRRKRT